MERAQKDLLNFVRQRIGKVNKLNFGFKNAIREMAEAKSRKHDNEPFCTGKEFVCRIEIAMLPVALFGKYYGWLKWF